MGTPYLTYTMPSTTANQPDLLIAQPNMNMKPGVVNFGFKHACTFIGFTLQGNNEQVKSIGIKGMSATGQLSLDGTTITWSNLGTATTTPINAGINYDSGQSYVTASTTQIPSSTLMQSDGYLMVIPQTLTSNTILVVTFADNTTRELALNAATPTWVAGNKYTYAVKISMALSTANCYILSPSPSMATNYYLNAIARLNQFWASAADGGFNGVDGDGYTNQLAYGKEKLNVIDTSDQWVFSVIWADFAQYTNVTIKQSGSTYGTGRTENLQITLTAGTYTGNMVIGVKKVGGSDNLWSFHLWITSFDPTLATSKGLLPSGETAMDRNLGATSNLVTAATSYGLFYQWGRKDPFIGSSTFRTSTKATLSTGFTQGTTANAGYLVHSVWFPNAFYTVTGVLGYDCITTGVLSGSYARWGGNSGDTNTALKSIKTLYDPCPPGWRIPWGTNWTGFSASFTSATLPANFQWTNSPNWGRIYTGVTPNINFPSAGSLSSADYSLSGVGTKGYYWSGYSGTTNNGNILDVESATGGGAISVTRATGCSVRCVVDN